MNFSLECNVSSDDIQFTRATQPAVYQQLSILSERAFNTANLLLSRFSKPVDHETVLENYGDVTDAVDSLLEAADTYLDEISGKRKNIANIPTANGETSNKSSFFALMRPQLTFPDKVDNSDTPFVSKLKFKHHALNNSEASMSTHPYFNEITYINHPSHMFHVRPEMMYASMEETSFFWVDTVDALQEMVLKLSNSSEISVDLEHHDYRSYLGFTCLIQVSTRTEDFVIDALKLSGQLHLLNDPFANPNIVKVLHGAQYDIVWLQRDFGVYVVNLFDTYHASHVLEMSGHSLAFLLQSYCNVSTDKKYQLADWRVRPLSDEMLLYARTDTHYLLYIYDKMRNELISREPLANNLLRVTLEKSALVALQEYEKPKLDPETSWVPLFKRYGAAYNAVQLEVFKALYFWRDNIARKHDESPRYVMPNKSLFQLSKVMPKDSAEVIKWSHPPTPIIRQMSSQIATLIDETRLNAIKSMENAMIKAPVIPEVVINPTHIRFEEEIEVEDLEDIKEMPTQDLELVSPSKKIKVESIHQSEIQIPIKTGPTLFAHSIQKKINTQNDHLWNLKYVFPAMNEHETTPQPIKKNPEPPKKEAIYVLSDMKSHENSKKTDTTTAGHLDWESTQKSFKFDAMQISKSQKQSIQVQDVDPEAFNTKIVNDMRANQERQEARLLENGAVFRPFSQIIDIADQNPHLAKKITKKRKAPSRYASFQKK